MSNRTRKLWDALLSWGERIDDRNLSDEARRWATTESGCTSQPENRGEWEASMQIAFDAGQQWKRMQENPDEG